MDRPDSVSRVTPPMTTIARIITQHSSSQIATARVAASGLRSATGREGTPTRGMDRCTGRNIAPIARATRRRGIRSRAWVMKLRAARSRRSHYSRAATGGSEAMGEPAGLAAQFRREFGREPRLFRAPGRVNLIGEHTDYNDGFVLPAALELATYVAAAPREDRRLRVRSLRMEAAAEFDLDEPSPARRRDWSDYVRGVAVVLEGAGERLTGADLMIWSDVPVGAGLSSSAALEVAVGYTLLSLAGRP